MDFSIIPPMTFYKPGIKVASNLLLLCILFTFSQTSYSGTTFIKISAAGAELLDDATEWSCVKHKVTGQLWEVKNVANSQTTYLFDGVSRLVNKRNTQHLCGFTDWRLPSIKELNSITDKTIYNPAIDLIYFPNTKFSFSSDPGY